MSETDLFKDDAMILSFSVDAMRPYLEAGARQALGEDVGGARVKRQTIRRRGPRAEAMLKWDTICGTHPYDMHLWWKSRTDERALIGAIPNLSPKARIRIYPITILHSSVKPVIGEEYQCIKIDGCHRWDKDNSCYFWSPDHGGDSFETFARADGFETVAAFRDYFVPNRGDVFNGVLYTW